MQNIIIEDSQKEIEIMVDTSRLPGTFFNNMFSGSYQFGDKIHVDDAQVALSVINGEEEYTDWENIKKIIKCKSYFGMDQNLNFLRNYSINFKEVLSLIDHVGYNKDLIACICYNLPNDYKIEDFLPYPGMIKALENIPKSQYLIILTEVTGIFEDGYVTDYKIYDYQTQKQIMSGTIDLIDIGSFQLLDDMKIFLPSGEIFDLWKNNLVQSINYGNDVFSVYIPSRDGKNIITRSPEEIRINSQTIITGKFNEPVAVSDDFKLIAYSTKDNHGHTIVHVIDFKGNIVFEKNIIHSRQYIIVDKILIVNKHRDYPWRGYDSIEFYDMQTGEKIREIIHKGFYSKISISPNQKYIATACNNNTDVTHFCVWEISSGASVFSYQYGGYTDMEIRFLGDNHIFCYTEYYWRGIIKNINEKAHQIAIPDHYGLLLYGECIDPKIKKLIDKLIGV